MANRLYHHGLSEQDYERGEWERDERRARRAERKEQEMAERQQTETARHWTEAPASATLRIDFNGFNTLFTMRADSGGELLEKLGVATKWMKDHGIEPQGGGGDTKTCPVHNATMHRHEKHGDVWWSHKLPDGSWCRGKAK